MTTKAKVFLLWWSGHTVENAAPQGKLSAGRGHLEVRPNPEISL